MDVVEILHSLMKKQRMNHESRVSRIGKLRKSFGSDESLWLAEVGRQQAIVDALGDQARRPRDDEMPRRFRQHALDYIKELVGVEAAMSILEDISEGKRCRATLRVVIALRLRERERGGWMKKKFLGFGFFFCFRFRFQLLQNKMQTSPLSSVPGDSSTR